MRITRGPQTSNPTTVTIKPSKRRRDDAERVSLSPLEPEGALRALLATPPSKD